jgi:thiol-disulfide isomerase/thioredoxin
MLRLIATACVLAAVALPARADDKPSEAAKQLQALQKEWQTKAKDAKDAEERKELFKDFAKKFVDLAEKNPKDPAAYAALVFVVQRSDRAALVDNTPSRTALRTLAKDHADNPKVGELTQALVLAGTKDSIQLVKSIIDKHPDKKVQARTCRTFLKTCEQMVAAAEQIQDSDKVRRAYEKQRGKEFVARILDNAKKNEAEATALKKLYKDKFESVLPDLSVGKTAPEVESQDLDGKKVKLSALRGKVVVLDIWATWCGPCRAMIPHERELVKRLKDKPFVLVSISADGEKEDLTGFLEKQKMPWTHWYNGPKGGIVEDWEVEYFPTIYVLDAKGVIRYKDVRGKDMDEAVDTLLKEMEEAKKEEK